jgi:hypothetical protein
MTKPMSRAEILSLPPTMNLPTLGRVLGLSEPTVRERERQGELEALGIKVVRLGAQYKVVTASVLAFLGIDAADGAGSESRPQVAAGQRHPSASALRSAPGDETG